MPDVLDFDVNQDGRSDLWWQNDATGENIVWEMNGSTQTDPILAGFHVPTAPGWEFGGSGDFDGDGLQDILLHHPTGDNIVWEFTDGVITDAGHLPNTGGFSVGATGDFAGGAQTDILWHNDATGENILWQMQAGAFGDPFFASIHESFRLEATPGYDVAGSGDFNGDNTDDILFHRDATGENVVWEMGGPGQQPVDVGYHLPTTPGWDIGGVSDFDGDGNADILLHNPNGETVLWLMQGGAEAPIADSAYLPTLPTSWEVGAVADVNGDLNNDIIWRDESGQTIVWEMDGFSITAGYHLPDVPTSWEVFA